jgi:hypothetical protein
VRLIFPGARIVGTPVIPLTTTGTDHFVHQAMR